MYKWLNSLRPFTSSAVILRMRFRPSSRILVEGGKPCGKLVKWPSKHATLSISLKHLQLWGQLVESSNKIVQTATTWTMVVIFSRRWYSFTLQYTFSKLYEMFLQGIPRRYSSILRNHQRGSSIWYAHQSILTEYQHYSINMAMGWWAYQMDAFLLICQNWMRFSDKFEKSCLFFVSFTTS